MSERLTAITPATPASQTPDASIPDPETPQTALDNNGAAVPADDEAVYSESPAHLGERLMAYALDGVVLFAFTMFFAAASFLNVYLRSDHGRDTAPDAAIWQSAYLLLLTVPAWFGFNLLFTSNRGYTIGQYVMGLRLRMAEAESAPQLKRLALYWVALHPLLFHPIFIGFWTFFAYVALSLSDSTVLFLIGGAFALMCILAPLANLGFAIFDRQRRTVHDLLAGVRVVRLD
jgi:uncharacterized RDD family membrane protein YckC